VTDPQRGTVFHLLGQRAVTWIERLTRVDWARVIREVGDVRF